MAPALPLNRDFGTCIPAAHRKWRPYEISADGVAHSEFVGERVQFLLQLGIQSDFDGRHAGSQLLGAAGSDDGRGNDRIREHPGDRQCGELNTTLRRQGRDPFDRRPVCNRRSLDSAEVPAPPTVADFLRAGGLAVEKSKSKQVSRQQLHKMVN